MKQKFLFLFTIVLATFCFISCSPDSEIKTYTVTFDANGAEGNEPVEIEVVEGKDITILSGNIFSNRGYNFVSWNTEKNGRGDSYQVSQSLKVSSNITLYAQWNSLEIHTLTLDFNNASGEKLYYTLFEGESFVFPSCDFSNEGYIFDSWNTNADESGNCYLESESIKVSKDMTLYAIWKPSCLDYTLSSDKNSYSVKCNDKTISSIVIPSLYKGKAVTSIERDAFNGCRTLTSIKIPESVTSIGSSAFNSCSGLTSVTIPDSVTSIGVSAFHSCSNLKTIEIGANVNSIGNTAFASCYAIEEVEIPNGVTIIEKDVFNNCKGLKKITIPNTVTKINDGALGYCSKLESICYRGTKEQWNKITKTSTWDSNTGTYTITYTKEPTSGDGSSSS